VVGSIEFAVSKFGSRLVVVMGHTRCGAVTATLETLNHGNDSDSMNIRAIVDRIAPHVRSYATPGKAELQNSVVDEAVAANVRASADHLRHASRVLEEFVLDGTVAVVGAVYELETGSVQFIDGTPS